MALDEAEIENFRQAQRISVPRRLNRNDHHLRPTHQLPFFFFFEQFVIHFST
jgi:hypothetical protein